LFLLFQLFLLLLLLKNAKLTSQRHYDFGMRTIKAVLITCGSLKSKHKTMKEESIVLKAIKDINLSKVICLFFFNFDIGMHNFRLFLKSGTGTEPKIRNSRNRNGFFKPKKKDPKTRTIFKRKIAFLLSGTGMKKKD
jgi:hypothetical protein